MRVPDENLLRRVKSGRIDSRTRREIFHYRRYVNALDQDGQPTDDPDKAVRFELTRRGRMMLGDR